MERFVGSLIVTPLSLPASVGPNQFAYQKARGARDALAYMTLTWIAGFNSKMKFCIYCSDVSGAFDRVSRPRLLAKLRASGVDEELVDLLSSWLDAREAVVVGGEQGDPMELHDMIYQGTVWGPWLWNLFYGDARRPLHKCSFSEIIFADDLNAFKRFRLGVPNGEVLAEGKRCQQELHAWGRANQVEFDPKKESLHVLSHHEPAGCNFKILSIDFDCRLTMADAVSVLVSDLRWKVRSILRAQRCQSVRGMINLYKSKVLSYAECRTAGVYHACASTLEGIDRVQSSFLRDIGVGELSAFMEFNLVPLSLRRDIAMLGLIHRAVLGQGPSHVREFFYLERQANRRSQRFRRHHLQLHEYRGGSHLDIVGRSALGLASVYNLLPRDIVEAMSVKHFQGLLQELARDLASRGIPDWQSLYSTQHDLHAHPLLRI